MNIATNISRFWSNSYQKNYKIIRSSGQLLGIWFALRIASSIFAGFVSYLRPFTEIEYKIPILPPSLPISEWFNRVFVAPWLRWDALWYERIVTHGYSATDGTAQFHPLYIWLATPLVKLGFSSTLSLLIISSLAGITLFAVYFRLLQLDMDQSDATFGLLLFALAPPSFVLFAPYSEALFLLFAVLCAFWIRKESWWLAGMAGGLAVLTRQQGIFLILPMAWELWENSSRKLSIAFKKWKNWLAVSLLPFSMIFWLGYRTFIIGDLQPDFSSFHSFVYSFLISPTATQVVTIQKFTWPWHVVYLSFQKLATNPDIDLWVNFIIGFLYLLVLAITWRRMRLSYKIYSFVVTFISFSYYTGPIHPYMGLPRHLLLSFPVFISLPQVINSRRKRLLFIAISSIGWFVLLGLYGLEAWVP